MRFKLIPERLRGELAAFDIKDKKGKLIVEEGRRITARHINLMEKAGLKLLDASDEYIHDCILARDVVDKESGEVLANANDMKSPRKSLPSCARPASARSRLYT